MTIEGLLSDTNYQQKSILQKLICHYLSYTREDMWLRSTEQIDQSIVDRIIQGYHDYVDRKMPLEYIIGSVQFLGRRFMVGPATLIPRAETEYMIQAVIEYIQEYSTSLVDNSLLLDIGTGCGVLGLSVLLEHNTIFGSAVLSDYSQEALDVAQKNYLFYKDSISTPLTFVTSDLLAFVTDSTYCRPTILVANLPYIPDETFDNNADQTVKAWEPRMAFVGGNDGLDLYRRMFQQYFDAVQQGYMSSSMVMFLEMMTRQVDILAQEFGDKLEFVEVKTFHFNIRIVKAIYKQ